MNGKSSCLAIATISFLLTAQSPVWAAERKTDANEFTAPASTGFLEPARDDLRPLFYSADPACIAAQRTNPRSQCSRDFVVPGASGSPAPGDEAYPLPHLNIVIYIDKFEHHAVSGGGIKTNTHDVDQFWMGWDFDSNADVIPLEMPDFPIFLDPGETLDSQRTVFRGQIANGCSSNQYVWLQMHNTIWHHDSLQVGKVEMEDYFIGYGKYTVHYTVTAEEDDMVSKFEFTGRAYATCTSHWVS